jgi:hypothetical protein
VGLVLRKTNLLVKNRKFSHKCYENLKASQ